MPILGPHAIYKQNLMVRLNFRSFFAISATYRKLKADRRPPGPYPSAEYKRGEISPPT